MKKLYYLLIIHAFILSGCHSASEDNHDHDHDHNPAHNHEPGSGHDHGKENHGDEIIIEPARAAALGIATEILSPADFTDMLSLSGQVEAMAEDGGVASSRASGILTLAPNIEIGASVKAGQTIATIKTDATQSGDQGAAAKARLAAAKRELDRLKPLYEERLVTADRYNGALAEYEAAKALCSSQGNSGVVKAPVAGIITSLAGSTGQFVSEGEPVATISKNNRLTLTVMVPAKYANEASGATDATFRLAGSDEWYSISSLDGKRISSSSFTGQQGGYSQIRFSFRNPGIAGAGSYAEVKLPVRQRGETISLPKEALVEQQDNYFVYVKVDEEGYEKKRVEIGGDDGQRVEIISGVKPGDDVVVKGAMMVKLAETATVAPEGHSH